MSQLIVIALAIVSIAVTTCRALPDVSIEIEKKAK